MGEVTIEAGSSWARGACYRSAQPGLLLAGVLLCLSVASGSQGKPPTPTLADARQKYLGVKVTITGPLVAPSAGLLRIYVNWCRAKKGAHGRYEPESTADWSRLGFGAERSPATIIAIQLSSKQPKGPWVDFLGNRHETYEFGPDFDFIVRFDEDGAMAMCTSSLPTASSNFKVVGKPGTQK